MNKPTISVFVGDMVIMPVEILRDLAKDYELSIRVEGTVEQCVAQMKQIKEALVPIEPKFLISVGGQLLAHAKDPQANALKVKRLF